MPTRAQMLAAHESVDLHEMLNMKTLGLAKSKLLQGLVFDVELKSLLKKDAEQSAQAIENLQRLYARAPFQAPVPPNRPTPTLDGGGEDE
ncbi:spore gernimation protein GerQ [Paenibacillus sambharensis]|uniref:Spore gernimation protein GerQ n=1 Tax=Paenibacillus sambharensis TaxID=1803190 RepID=A0A2W1LRF5_9BACL|nr:spore gernimation protein GerQ [Paenibacillus sambharensis]PZD97542.1 spore gernimation protein GerQ [Paenibacillus sambharensis]